MMPLSPTETAHLIDGRAIAAEIRAEVKEDVGHWTAIGRRPPKLSVVLIGDNIASTTYVRGKERACAEVGIESEVLRFPNTITEAELLTLIHRLNDDDRVDGILVQLPLPDRIDPQKVIRSIHPKKDVDGFHPENTGRIVTRRPGLVPATPGGVVELLRRNHIETEGKHVVVVGRSRVVGTPLTNMLFLPPCNATVTNCHIHTENLGHYTAQADILIVAVGKVNLITEDMVKPGAVVIDVGINRVDDPTRKRGYRLVGDVDFERVQHRASRITPVPGGVGPMTVALLLKNLMLAAQANLY